MNPRLKPAPDINSINSSPCGARSIDVKGRKIEGLKMPNRFPDIEFISRLLCGVTISGNLYFYSQYYLRKFKKISSV